MRSFRVCLFTVFAAALLMCLAASPAFAQGITTSGISGFVTDQAGHGVPGATVVITHVPTGSATSVTTRANGQYSANQLRVGGPYSVNVSAPGLGAAERTDVNLELENTASADFTLRATDVVELSAFRVEAEADTTFNPNKQSNGTDFNSAEVNLTPAIRRDVQEIANRDSRLSLVENTSTGEFQLSAPGQNFRYNSFLIDGVQANDPFGINSNGFSTLRSPVPLDAIEALSIDLSPYDVRRSGFTGALINAVIKSGTNSFHGSTYFTYSSQRLRAKNPVTHVRDTFRDRTYGATFGGPLIPNKLFFFLAYDDFRRVAAAPSATFVPTAAAIQSTIATAKSFGYEAGNLYSDAITFQKTYLAKLDWNISQQHRLSTTYRRNVGETPQYADYLSSTFVGVGGSTTNSRTSFSNHWYIQPRISDNYTAQLFSTWTPDFHTEATIAVSKYNGSPRNNGTPFPEIDLRNVPGVDLTTGATVTGDLYLGTERSRQFNFITTKTYNGSMVGEYAWGTHTLTFGGDTSKNDVNNQFAQYALGQYIINGAVTASNPTGGWAPTSSITSLRQALLYSGYTLDQAFAQFSLTNFGVFLQDRWQLSQRFQVLAGLRMDYPYVGDKPLFNQSFTNAFGIRNNTTGSGNYTVAPRLGFNYQFKTKRRVQLRGGLGVFQGTNPTVWLSNSYSNVGALATATTTPTTFTPTTTLQSGTAAQNVNVTDPRFKQPVAIKGNLAFDYELPWWGIIFTAQTDQSKQAKSPYVVSMNLWTPTTGPTLLPDGRNRYVRAPAYGTGGAKSFFGDVYYLTDSNKGKAESYSVGFTKPMKNKWSASISYTHSFATEVNPMTSSVAFSNFSQRAIANPNEDVASRSNYSIPDKLVISATRQFELFGRHDAKTSLSLVYRAQSGHPYSWVFLGDANGEGISGNDLLFVPTGPDDTRVRFASPEQQAAFFNFIDGAGLKEFKGRIVPRNSALGHWISTVDFHLSQEIPVWRKVRLEGFFDFLNLANLINKKYGIVEGIDFPYTRTAVSATFDPIANGGAGQYVYTFNSNTVAPSTVYTTQSRWQVQVGARLKF